MSDSLKNIYFVGIGGIGMSAIARYFIHEGHRVAGYDRVESALTRELSQLGVEVHYDDCLDMIPECFKDVDSTLVVYTPAIPHDHKELNYFLTGGFEIVKRSKMLGVLSNGKFLMAVAGTHGKTSTSTMLAHFNSVSTGGGSAFLGGISKNYDSNLILGSGDRLTVEADEFDRSFLQLYPDVALITSTDADHLDIYNNHNALKDTFSQFTSQIKSGGVLIYRYGIDLIVANNDIKIYTYSLSQNSDFRAENICPVGDGTYKFDIVCPDMVIEGCHLGVGGRINVENCVGAVAMLWAAGDFDQITLRMAIDNFRGVKRRFDVYINSPQIIYIDDYAHHPQELLSTIESIRSLYPDKRITAVFQPHLYTRTRDFVDGFASSLSLCDRVILLPIYPARELPIEGVNSNIILDRITTDKVLVEKSELIELLSSENADILITFGAGDIDAFCKPIYQMLCKRFNVC